MDNKIMYAAQEVNIPYKSSFRGETKLYEITSPFDVKDWDGNVEIAGVQFVVASHVNEGLVLETYLFPVNLVDGNIIEVLNWGELPGSRKCSTPMFDVVIRDFVADLNGE
jgi:hypothetical protein